MKDMDAVRYNEKVKRISTLVGGGGLGLILTALTRWLDQGADLYTAGWTIAGFILI